jgi:hypothetical protein
VFDLAVGFRRLREVYSTTVIGLVYDHPLKFYQTAVFAHINIWTINYHLEGWRSSPERPVGPRTPTSW